MPIIHFDSNYVTQAELEEHSTLISQIEAGCVAKGNTKKTKAFKYLKQYDVFRAREGKTRILFTYVPYKNQTTLLFLSIETNHNYARVGRALGSPNANIEEFQLQDDEKLTPDTATAAAPAPAIQGKAADAKEPQLTWKSLIPFNGEHLELDKGQKKGLQLNTPLLMRGPPGTGKTTVLYAQMCRDLLSEPSAATATATATAPAQPDEPPALFISTSQELLDTLKHHHRMTHHAPVEFKTWAAFLKDSLKREIAPKEDFRAYSLKYFPKAEDSVIHYELSLLTTMGAVQYLALGQRQSHFYNDKTQQTALLKLQKEWLKYLDDKKLIDPMVTQLPDTIRQRRVYCDEAQNQCPNALARLIQITSGTHFIATLDPEQCLETSPFIESCFHYLLGKQFNNTYFKHDLERTWRCPIAVTDVANRLMKTKYLLDTTSHNRRSYTSIESALETQGLVSWVDAKNLHQLKAYTKSAHTVVIVAQEPKPAERELMNERLGTNNILTAAQVIGLEFKNVIIYLPMTQSPLGDLGKKHLAAGGLTLKQWYTFNAFYVAITRTKERLYIVDDRQTALTQQLFGTLAENQFTMTMKPCSEAEQRQEWEDLVQTHLTEGRIENAKQIMAYHLQLSTEQIQQRIGEFNKPKTVRYELVDYKNEPSKPIPPRRPKSRKDAKSPLEEPKDSSALVTTPLKLTKDQETLAYIEALLKNRSVASIKKLFREKPKVQELLLFKHKLPNGLCLFQELCAYFPESETLFALIPVKLLAKYFTTQFIHTPHSQTSASILDYFLYEKMPAADSLMMRLLAHKPELVRMISGTELCKRRNSADKRSSLYGMCHGNGLLLFTLLLERNPELAKSITSEALIARLPAEAGVDVGKSPLLLLAEFGIKVLNKLLELNPGLAKEITADALCRPLPKEARTDANVSILLKLCKEESIPVLFRLFELHPDLAKGITAEALCRPIPKEAGPDEVNKTPLIFLASTDGALFKLLKLNPGLAQGITAEVMCRPLQGHGTGKTPLLIFLFYHPATIKLLFELNPKLAQGITALAMYKPHPKETGPLANCTSFLLLSSESNNALLRLLFELNPELVQGITAEVLCRAISIKATISPNVSPLHQLSNPKNISMFEWILKRNPGSTKGITAEALLLSPPAGSCPLELLSQSQQGVGILNLFLTNTPGLRQQLTPKILNRYGIKIDQTKATAEQSTAAATTSATATATAAASAAAPVVPTLLKIGILATSSDSKKEPASSQHLPRIGNE